MFNIRRLGVIATMSVLLAGSALAQGSGMDKLLGLWELDYDLTMMELKKKLEGTGQSVEARVSGMKDIAERFRTRIEKDRMVKLSGDSETPVPFVVLSTSPDSVKVKCSYRGKTIEMQFFLLGDHHMRYESAGTDALTLRHPQDETIPCSLCDSRSSPLGHWILVVGCWIFRLHSRSTLFGWALIRGMTPPGLNAR